MERLRSSPPAAAPSPAVERLHFSPPAAAPSPAVERLHFSPPAAAPSPAVERLHSSPSIELARLPACGGTVVRYWQHRRPLGVE